MSIRNWCWRIVAGVLTGLMLSLFALPASAETVAIVADKSWSQFVNSNSQSIQQFAAEAADGHSNAEFDSLLRNKFTSLGSLSAETQASKVAVTGAEATAKIAMYGHCKSFKIFIANSNCPGYYGYEKGKAIWVDGKQSLQRTIDTYSVTKAKAGVYSSVINVEGAKTKTSKAQRVAEAKVNKASTAMAKTLDDALGKATRKSLWAGIKEAGFKGSAKVLATGAFRGLNGLGWALQAQQLGTWAGSSLMHAFMDVDGVVCDNTGSDFIGSSLRYFSGANCSKVENTAAQDFANKLTASGELCGTVNGVHSCIKVDRIEHVRYSGSPDFHATAFIGSRTGYVTLYVDGKDQPPQGYLHWDDASKKRVFVPDVYKFAAITPNSVLPWGQRATTICMGADRAGCAKDASGELVWENPATDNQAWDTCIKYGDGDEACSGAAGEQFKQSDSAVPLASSGGSLVNEKGEPATSLTYVSVNQDNGARTKQLEADVRPEYQAFARAHPDCVDGVSCELDLIQVSSGLSCFDLHEVCADWYTATKSGSTPATDYQCTYDGQVLALSECTVYANEFKAETQASGQTASDPTTGEAIAGETVTQPASHAATDNASCWSSGWSWNPLDWVLTPVKCALQWAFVPDTYILNEKSETLKLLAEQSPVATLVAVFTVPGGAGCGGLPVSVPVWKDGEGDSISFGGTFADSCSDEMSTVAAWTRNLVSVLVIGGGVFAITRLVAGVVGYRGVKGDEDA